MTNSYCQPTEANFWFPVAPGVTSLPANPLPTTNPVPLPANAVAVPVGFDESNPDLCELFETILPTGADPVYPVTVDPTQSVPPYNEVVVYDLRIRKYLVLQSFDYPLNTATEIGAIAVRLEITVKTVKPVPVALVELGLGALPPEVAFAVKTFGKVVEVVNYEGTGSTPQQLATQWPASMMLLYSPGYDWLWFDAIRGNRAWLPNSSTEFDISGSISFGENGVTVQGDGVNYDSASYRAYIFKGKKEPIQNTTGSIQTTIRESDAFNIVSYTGTGTAATIGHGLGETPSLLIFKSAQSSSIIGGPYIGANFYIFAASDNARQADNSAITGFSNTVINIGTSSTVNSLGQQHTCYAFRQRENQCKIDTYYGNGLASGQIINCGFSIGVILVKNITNNGRWLLLNEKDSNQGFVVPSWRNPFDQVQNERIYDFDGNNFKVYSTSNSVSTTFQLNRPGEQYIYMALAIGFYRKLNCPSAAVSVQIYAPIVAAGVTVNIETIIISVFVVAPPYIGKRVTFVPVRRTSIELEAYEATVNSGVNVSPSVVTLEFNASVVPYVGEVAQDGRTYVAIVESRDGQPLEGSVQGCIYRLIKDLKNAGLWSKFLTIVPTCAARTVLGAVVPLRGRFPNTSGVTLTNFNYNRRAGLKPITASGQLNTNLTSTEVPATDNHLAVYVSQFNDATLGSGGDLIGDGFTTNSLGIGRLTSGSGFQTRNKNSATATSSAPNWSQPSLVGTTRQNSSSYIVRVADTNRSVTSSIADQATNVRFNSIYMFNFWNGIGNFRVPLYSIGMGLDLAVLEEIFEAFLERIKLIGLPDTSILIPCRNIQTQAIDPFLAGRFRILVKVPESQQSVYAEIPGISSGVAISVASVDTIISSVNVLYAGQEQPVAYIPPVETSIHQLAPSVATGVQIVAQSLSYSMLARPPAKVGDLLKKITGRIFSYYSYSSPTSGTGNDPNVTTEPTYAARFGNILPYQPTPRLWDYCDSNSCDLLRTEGIFNHFRIGWNMEMEAENGCWMSDQSDFDLEFQTSSGVTVAAIRAIANEGNFRNGLYYGASLSSLTKAGQVGLYPNTGGTLTSTATQLIYANFRSSNFNSSWTFNCDMTQVRRLRLTNVNVESNWTGGVCGAYNRLEIMSYTAP